MAIDNLGLATLFRLALLAFVLWLVWTRSKIKKRRILSSLIETASLFLTNVKEAQADPTDSVFIAKQPFVRGNFGERVVEVEQTLGMGKGNYPFFKLRITTSVPFRFSLRPQKFFLGFDFNRPFFEEGNLVQTNPFLKMMFRSPSANLKLGEEQVQALLNLSELDKFRLCRIEDGKLQIWFSGMLLGANAEMKIQAIKKVLLAFS